MEKKVNKVFKLSIILLYNAILFYLSIGLTHMSFRKNGVKFIYLPIYNILILTLFFLIYFSLMWKDLYSKNYHYYYKFTYTIVIKNLSIATLIITIIISVLFILNMFYINIQLNKLKFLIAYLLMSMVTFSALHILEFNWIKYLSKLGYFKRKVLVIGNPDKRLPLDLYFQDLGNTKEYAGRIIFNNGKYFIEGKDSILSICDNIENLILKKNIGELILFLGDEIKEKLLLDTVRFCRKYSIGYTIVPDIKTLPMKYPWDKPFPNIPTVEIFHTTKDSLAFISIKRLLDIIISAVALLCFIPVGIVIAFAIKFEDHGPIIYVSKRIGKGGRPIQFYKFRSMTVDAEKNIKKLLKYNERNDGPLFKMKKDPRVTKVGKILRKYSFDEVPQLINVLKGDMSIVGPRPHLPQEVEAYQGTDYLRLECMPGIVCLPQIYGRNYISFREWVDYDLQYRKNWSVFLDLEIMIKTASLILTSFFVKGNHGF